MSAASPENFPTYLNSLTTKKQTTKFSSANFQKMLGPSYIIFLTPHAKGHNYFKQEYRKLPGGHAPKCQK